MFHGKIGSICQIQKSECMIIRCREYDVTSLFHVGIPQPPKWELE